MIRSYFQWILECRFARNAGSIVQTFHVIGNCCLNNNVVQLESKLDLLGLLLEKILIDPSYHLKKRTAK